MKAIISAFALAHERPDICFKIYWEKTTDCCAKFLDLFKPIHTNANISFHELHGFVLRPSRKRNLYLPKILRKFTFVFDGDYDGGAIANEPIESWLNGKKRIYITSYNRFCPSRLGGGKIGDLFFPADDIEQIIGSVTSQFSKNTIGVHIRRTDNVASIQNSPLEMFTEVMDEQIKSDETVKFYIASDDENVKDYMKEKYGDRIITHKWSLTRGTVEGMKDAVAELFCLARTNSLIGSTNSTYSLMASALYGIPIINRQKIRSTTQCDI